MPLGAFRTGFLGALGVIVEGENTLNAISFTSSDYLYMSSKVATGSSDNKTATWSVWVKLSNSSVRSLPFGMYNEAINSSTPRYFYPSFYDNTTDATATFYHRTTTATLVRTSSETNLYNTGEWIHICASYDASTTAEPQVYVNGVKATMPEIAAQASNFPWDEIDLWINGLGDGTDTNSIEVAQVYINNAYTDLSTNLYKFYNTNNNCAVDMGTNGTKSGLPQPLVYHNGSVGTFETNGGTVTYSLSTNGSPTTSTGPIVKRVQIPITASDNAQVDTAQSKFGGASALFDGSNDLLTVNSFTGQELTGEFTIEFWGRFDILPQNQTIGGGSYMMFYSQGPNNYLLVDHTGTNRIISIGSSAGGSQSYFNGQWTSTNWAINTWYHIAITRQSDDSFKFFIDGVEANTYSLSSKSGQWLSTNTNLTLGRFIDSRGSWDGHIDEIRISNIARYTANFTAPTEPFVNDANTLLLIHADGTDGSTVFEDDVGT